mmetsp:Transcript_33153/g.76470  ORF Transcript_33153/g.76470 Transcript_33153/m.76470 type:complete len:400 (+) Transcript_33153:2858-4057(+)
MGIVFDPVLRRHELSLDLRRRPTGHGFKETGGALISPYNVGDIIDAESIPQILLEIHQPTLDGGHDLVPIGATAADGHQQGFLSILSRLGCIFGHHFHQTFDRGSGAFLADHPTGPGEGLGNHSVQPPRAPRLDLDGADESVPHGLPHLQRLEPRHGGLSAQSLRERRNAGSEASHLLGTEDVGRPGTEPFTPLDPGARPGGLQEHARGFLPPTRLLKEEVVDGTHPSVVLGGGAEGVHRFSELVGDSVGRLLQVCLGVGAEEPVDGREGAGGRVGPGRGRDDDARVCEGALRHRRKVVGDHGRQAIFGFVEEVGPFLVFEHGDELRGARCHFFSVGEEVTFGGADHAAGELARGVRGEVLRFEAGLVLKGLLHVFRNFGYGGRIAANGAEKIASGRFA